MKKIIIGAALLVVVAVILVFIIDGKNKGSPNEALLSDTAEFMVYNINGEPTGSAFISLEFRIESENMVANVLADLNGDGLFETGDEWIVKNTRVNIKPNFPNRISFLTGENNLADREAIDIRVMLSPEAIENSGDVAVEKVIPAKVVRNDSGEQLGVNVPGASIELKRGTLLWPTPVAAQNGSEPVDIQLDDLPDLSGGPMDCFPVATANNLIYLAGKNGKRDDLPTNPQDIVDELKTDMQFNNGVLLRNFESGKKTFVEKYNLPVETRRIDKPSFDDIKNAIESGGVVELSTGMTQSQSGEANTGHVMAVAGVIADGGQVGFTASDPATPVGGTEIFELTPPPEGSDVWTFNYPLWDGITFIDAIFVQTWKSDDTTALSVGDNQTLTGTQIPFGQGSKEVEVLVIGGLNYPKFQFYKSDPQGHNACGTEHWHSNQIVVNIVVNIEDDKKGIQFMTDPNPSSCGFGKTSEVPEAVIQITEDEASKFFGEYLIQNP